jgi:uncharacterized protein YabN with tetrapyrrole methylase and pyrophosphatase domain
MQDREYGQTLDSINEKWEELKKYKKTDKPAKTNEKLELEAALNNLQAKLKLNNRSPFQPPEELAPATIDKLWDNLGNEETQRSDWIRKEIERQRRIENLVFILIVFVFVLINIIFRHLDSGERQRLC